MIFLKLSKRLVMISVLSCICIFPPAYGQGQAEAEGYDAWGAEGQVDAEDIVSGMTPQQIERKKNRDMCAVYTDKDKKYAKAFGDEVVDKKCDAEGQLVTIRQDDLVNSIFDLKKHTVKRLALDFSKRISDETYLALMDNKAIWAESYPAASNVGERKALNCGEEEVADKSAVKKIKEKIFGLKKVKEDKQKQLELLEAHIPMAFVAGAMMKIKEKAKKIYTDDNNKCMASSRKAADPDAFESKCHKNAQKLKKEYEKKNLDPYYEVAKGYPILFQEEAKFFAELGASPLTSSMLSIFDPKGEAVEEIQKILEGEGDLAVKLKSSVEAISKRGEILEENFPLSLDDMSTPAKLGNFEKLNGLASAAVNRLMGEIDNAAQRICEDRSKEEGSFLHLNDNLVNSHFSNFALQNKGNTKFKERLMEEQMAYCYLKDEHSVSSNLSLYAVGGFGMFGLGLLTGPAGFIIGGFGLAAVGVKDTVDAAKDYTTSKGLFVSGWTEWEKVKEAKKNKNLNLAFNALDVVTGGFDMVALKGLKATAQSARAAKLAEAIKAEGQSVKALPVNYYQPEVILSPDSKGKALKTLLDQTTRKSDDAQFLLKEMDKLSVEEQRLLDELFFLVEKNSPPETSMDEVVKIVRNATSNCF